ncbi:hypothetical protein JD844_020730 [Phrynosoma platyrhinos]|uniref:Cholesterol 24-hydroxylase n=1 Tax=Phrynosoma platyrhinos TaxID=52577 RepID=A0ABQ7SSS3_PHRPL|nr:hypothetical protein JD844_020730 [Phrynosoma platyrhinos]
MLKKKEVTHELFLHWAEEYGPVVRINTFHRVSVLILSPEGVKEYLMLPKYPKDRSLYKNLASIFGVSYLIGLIGTFNDQAEEFMKELGKKADGETKVDMMYLMRRVAFGLELNTLHDEQTPIPHAVNMAMTGIANVRIPFFKYMPGNREVISEIRESLRFLRHTGKQCIDQRRKAIQNGEEVPLDILTQILKTSGHETTANQLSFTVMELGRHPDIVARLTIRRKNPKDSGTREVSKKDPKGKGKQERRNEEKFEAEKAVVIKKKAMSSDIKLLPDKRGPIKDRQDNQGREDLDLDCGKGSGGEVAPEDCDLVIDEETDLVIDEENDMDVESEEGGDKVLKEVLRLYPLAASTIRWTGTEKIIEGVKIPANTTLVFSSYIMGRMEKYFKDALTFNPDRFGKGQPKPYFSYFPFSLGPRSCIGQVFAQMEAKVVMAKFLQRFDYELVPPQSFKFLDTGTLTPSDAPKPDFTSQPEQDDNLGIMVPDLQELEEKDSSETISRKSLSKPAQGHGWCLLEKYSHH